jgi:hypothetical protein
MMRKILVLVAAAVFVLGLSTSSWAIAEFDIGATIRTNIQYNVFNDDRVLVEDGPTQDDGYGDLTLSVPNGGRARIFLNGTLDDFTSRFELRMGDDNRDKVRGIRADRASATWNFAEGMYFLFGLDSDEVDLHWSDAVMNDSGNFQFGAIGDQKEWQIQLGGSTEMFTWAIVAANPWDVTGDGSELELDIGNFESEHALFPRFEGIVKFAVGEMFDFGVSGWVQNIELQNSPTFSDEDITEWGFNTRARFYSDYVNVGAGFFYGNNLGVSGVDGADGLYDSEGGIGVDANGKVEDVNTFGGLITFSIPLEPVTIGVGGGFETANTDVDIGLVSGAPLPEDDWTQWNMYVNVLYNFTDNFSIIPEFWYADYGDSFEDVDQGTEWVIGARLQADF